MHFPDFRDAARGDLPPFAKHAFSGCTALRSITLPASLQVIEDGAFDGCSALAEVNFLNRWTVVGKTAFSGCPFQYQPPEADGEESLFTYEISTTGRNKGATVTGYLGTDEKIRIPQMLGGTLVVAIGKEAFKGNQYLTEVDMPDTVTKIGRLCVSGLHQPKKSSSPRSSGENRHHHLQGLHWLGRTQYPGTGSRI